MSEGWIALHRGWRENPVFRGEFSRADAWIWLIENAAWKVCSPDAETLVESLPIGATAFSASWLADRFQCNLSQLRAIVSAIGGTAPLSITWNSDDMIIASVENVDAICINPAAKPAPVARDPQWGPTKPNRRHIASSTRKAVLARGVCAYCQTDIGPFHIDHRKPFSRGGSYHIANLELACTGCNLSKGSKTLGRWRGR